jgi:hypothetical protein
MSGDAREAFARFIPDGDVAAFAEGLPEMLRSAFTETMNLLRDLDFQDLLVNYPRPPRTFLVAVETKDEVTSEWLIKGATGQEFKPTDYLTAFEAFVRANAEHVEAISMLLPSDAHKGVEAPRQPIGARMVGKSPGTAAVAVGDTPCGKENPARVIFATYRAA